MFFAGGYDHRLPLQRTRPRTYPMAAPHLSLGLHLDRPFDVRFAQPKEEMGLKRHCGQPLGPRLLPQPPVGPIDHKATHSLPVPDREPHRSTQGTHLCAMRRASEESLCSTLMQVISVLHPTQAQDEVTPSRGKSQRCTNSGRKVPLQEPPMPTP